MSSETKHKIVDILGVDYTTNHGNYLGLPLLIGRSKTDIFDFLKDKAWSQMNGWRHKFLSHAGKEVLLKDVVQVIPTYVMSVFYLTLILYEELERMMNSFWWGSGDPNRGFLRCKHWAKLSTHKAEGGLRFLRIHEYNLALLAKQGWKLVSDPHSLASEVLKAHYFPHGSFLNACIGHNPSYVWRSIMASQALIRQGACERIGSGRQTKIWGDPWLPDLTNPFIESPHNPELINQTVNSLCLSET